ncbi:MAG TPA: UbiD family decarboxylase [Elusimicrobiota bacterium]|nr:UbiD family decarboxylase [Elusimicrobiota bacterium]
MSFRDLHDFILFLDEKKDLRRVRVEVDPELEMTEIAMRIVRQDGPAILFENVKGSAFPVLMNIFGAERRIRWTLGRDPGDVGRELAGTARDFMPPRISSFWKHRDLLPRVLGMKPRRAWTAPVRDVSARPDLTILPVLKCWPKDGGRFFTFPLIVTRSPSNHIQNMGVYRLQIFDETHTGMHWQIERGGAFHYEEAERRNEPLPAAVVLGGDPILLLAGVLSLPEDFDELSFAGYLRGRSVPVVKTTHGGLMVPADAEFVLEGVVPPFVRKPEGPFGDHYGHYSQTAPFPVFELKRMVHRRGAIYPASVVGRPPQEDRFLGDATQQMFLPLLKLIHPELVDLWAYHESGFHNLLVASSVQRYEKEALKTAFALFGEGQASLTKCIVMVDPEVPVRDFKSVLRSVRDHFDPEDDFLLLPGTSQDTLDFTGRRMNRGSKMILDATQSHKRPRQKKEGGSARASEFMDKLGGSVGPWRIWEDALLVVQVKSDGRRWVERLVKEPALQGLPLIAVVSEDIPLDDLGQIIYGIFSRFDCELDLIPAHSELRGGRAIVSGPLGFDATWKEGYPEPLVMDPDVVQKVTRRWSEYGLP